MFSFAAFLRRYLTRKGYLLQRVEPEMPPSLADYLRARVTAQHSLLCCDNDPYLVARALEAAPASRVTFASPLTTPAGDGLLPGAAVSAPAGPFVLAVDGETFRLGDLFRQLPWLAQADAIVVRTRLGSFWAGRLDLATLVAELERAGFHLHDLLDFASTPYLHGCAGRAIFAFQRRPRIPENRPREQRLGEALAFLSTPLVRGEDFRVLTGRGSFGFGAGVYNPGSLVDRDTTYLLPRAERIPWASARTDQARYFDGCHPLLLRLDGAGGIAEATELQPEGLPHPAATRVMDFRLFRLGESVYVNHAVALAPGETARPGRPVRIEDLSIRVGLSRLDLAAKRFVWCGYPQLDRPTARVEKNWAFFSDGHKLHLLYSMSPYVVLTATDAAQWKFATAVDEPTQLPFAADGAHLRNSINPVDYDEAHWLHVVHKVYPGKQYCFWPVLIDKRSLRPVRTTARPLAAGWQSSHASILYVCSVLVRPTEIVLGAGLDDSSTATCTVPRARLDAEWIACGPAATAQAAGKTLLNDREAPASSGSRLCKST